MHCFSTVLLMLFNFLNIFHETNYLEYVSNTSYCQWARLHRHRHRNFNTVVLLLQSFRICKHRSNLDSQTDDKWRCNGMRYSVLNIRECEWVICKRDDKKKISKTYKHILSFNRMIVCSKRRIFCKSQRERRINV